jgi:AcrR family transcriptional regulator
MKADTKPRDGRARLLAAAQQLYLRHGASNVGINDVIEAAGVARMTLYNNFESKEELTAAVYEEMAATTLRFVEAAGAGLDTEAGRIGAIIDLFAMGMNSPEYRGCPFIHACLQESKPSGQIVALVRSYKLALRDRILRALATRRANREDVADQIMLLLDGAVTEAYIRAVAQPLQTAKRAAMVLLKS